MTKKNFLSISYSQSRIGFFAIKKNGNFFYKSLKVESSIQETVEIFFLENPKLRNMHYEEVLLISFEKEFVVLPCIDDQIEISERDIVQNFISENYLLEENKTSTKLKFSDTIKNYHCETLYKVDEEFYKSISKHFDNIKFRHCTNLFLNNISCSEQDEMHFLLNKESLLVCVFREKKMIFCNLFVADTDEEVLFYILKTTDLLNLENSSLQVFFYGFFHKNSLLLKQLFKIFPLLKAGEKNEKKREYFLSFCSNI